MRDAPPGSRASRRGQDAVLRIRLTGWRWGFAVAAYVLGGVLATVFVLLAVLLGRRRPGADELPWIWLSALGAAVVGAVAGRLLARSCRYTDVDPRRRVVQRADGGAVPFEAVCALLLTQTCVEVMNQTTPLFHVALVTDRADGRLVAACRAAAAPGEGEGRPAPEVTEALAGADEEGVIAVCANASAGYARRAAGEAALRLDVPVLVVSAAGEPRFVRVPRGLPGDGQRRSRYGLLDS